MKIDAKDGAVAILNPRRRDDETQLEYRNPQRLCKKAVAQYRAGRMVYESAPIQSATDPTTLRTVFVAVKGAKPYCRTGFVPYSRRAS